MVAGNLRNHHDGRQRTADRRRDKTRHPDKREGCRMDPDAARKNSLESDADSNAQRTATHKRRGENATRTARANRT